jgi:hypothetical protein
LIFLFFFFDGSVAAKARSTAFSRANKAANAAFYDHRYRGFHSANNALYGNATGAFRQAPVRPPGLPGPLVPGISETFHDCWTSCTLQFGTILLTSACPSSQICSIILFELHVFPVRCAPEYPPPPPPPPPLLWRRHRAGPRREPALQARSQLPVPFPQLLACSTAF